MSTIPSASRHCLCKVPGYLRGFAVVIAFLALAGTVTLVILEERWAPPNLRSDPAKVFHEGSIGTELAPLAVMEVLPDLFPDFLQPQRDNPEDWIDQFGFVRDPSGSPLPVGFSVSNYRPKSASPSPIPFVGLSCAACHSQAFRVEGEPVHVLDGPGNPHANVLAFSEAFRGLIVAKNEPGEYRLTLKSIEDAHRKKGRELTIAESIMIRLWINAARSEEISYARVIDDPLPPTKLLDPLYIRAGPSRTQPFRSLVRNVMDRPGAAADESRLDHGFSKIPAVYHQDHAYHGDWAQFDGSIRDINARSALASLTAGSSVHSLAHKEISHNIKQAAEHTKHLDPPKWADIPSLKKFPINQASAEAGAKVYQQSCYSCHGKPGDQHKGWQPGTAGKFGTIIDVGTSVERIHFRHKPEAAGALHRQFADYPKKHPLIFKREDIRAPEEDGYYCGPIGGSFLRAPYLHNASIMTLAELIGLKDRQPTFYRGRNDFDPQDVGLKSPEKPTHANYFKFDTSIKGNSNRGHYYPEWAWEKDKDGIPKPKKLDAQKQQELKDLLEYLKTL